MPTPKDPACLTRTIGLGSAVSLNVINMIGVGPFITLPLVVAAMGGPQAILGWVLGAVIAICDGLVWAELGAALPRAGGSYAFLREIYRRDDPRNGEVVSRQSDVRAEQGEASHKKARALSKPAMLPSKPAAEPGKHAAVPPSKHAVAGNDDAPVSLSEVKDLRLASEPAPRTGPGRYLSFLYIWQLSFTAPLSIASGCIGLAQYAAYLYPPLVSPIARTPIHWTSLLAASVCALVIVLLYRGLDSITRIARVLTVGVLATVGAVIVAGFTHMQPLLLRLPPHALAPTHAFFQGLGVAALVATYDYWGYYNVCLLGGEVRDPGRTIPRAVLLSILLVATLYLAMHIAVLGAVPWQALVAGSGNGTHAAAAILMDRTWGHRAAIGISLLIMWTAFASVAALLLGYSRAPYAAAVDGNYFRAFARLHPRHGFPYVSLLALGGAAIFFCFFNLAQVIAALVAVRIVLQYVLQQIGVIVLRVRRPSLVRPFRMWLYPLPPIVALAGFLFLLFSRKGAGRELAFAAVIAFTGTALFLVRERYVRAAAPA